MVKERNDGVVGIRFVMEVYWFVVVFVFVDNIVGEYGLVGDVEDEGMVVDVVFRMGVVLYSFYGFFNDFYG